MDAGTVPGIAPIVGRERGHIVAGAQLARNVLVSPAQVLAILLAETSDKPVWALFWATVGLAVVTAGVVVAAFRALGQLTETRMDRHLQVIGELGRRWDADDLVTARNKVLPYDEVQLAEEVAKCLAKPGSGELQVWLRVPNFFEDLALMVELGGLDMRPVDLAFGYMVKRGWQHWEPSIIEMRKTRGADLYAQFEALAKQVHALRPPAN